MHYVIYCYLGVKSTLSPHNGSPASKQLNYRGVKAENL